MSVHWYQSSKYTRSEVNNELTMNFHENATTGQKVVSCIILQILYATGFVNLNRGHGWKHYLTNLDYLTTGACLPTLYKVSCLLWNLHWQLHSLKNSRFKLRLLNELLSWQKKLTSVSVALPSSSCTLEALRTTIKTLLIVNANVLTLYFSQFWTAKWIDRCNHFNINGKLSILRTRGGYSTILNALYFPSSMRGGTFNTVPHYANIVRRRWVYLLQVET